MSKQKLKAFITLTRLDKPIGSLLLLWPTCWALWLSSYSINANHFPDLKIFIIFFLGVIFMRSAGCVINDYADRHIDGAVKRTQNRPLAQKIVSEKEALILFFSLIIISFLLVLQLNFLTIKLSFIGAFLATIYPFMKRITHLPQLVLGMAFSFSIPMAYTAITNQLDLVSLVLFLANIFWTVAYDTQYAMVDRDDDLRIGVKSTAILFASYDNKIIALLQFLTLACLYLVGYLEQLNLSYFIIISISALSFVYQCKLTRSRKRELCFKAFLANNYFGLMVFIAIFVATF